MGIITEINPETIAVVVVECEVYSRVVGYYRPVERWNDGKRREWEDRYLVPKTGLCNPEPPRVE